MPKTSEFDVLRKFPPEKGWGALRHRELMIQIGRRYFIKPDELEFVEAFNSGKWPQAKEAWDTIQERWKADQKKKAEEDAKKEAEKKASEAKEPSPPK